jgi:hypothetical protein
MTLGVRTPGAPQVSFVAWMNAKLHPKATFGGIVRATLGSKPRDARFNTDVLIGRQFQHLTRNSEEGWPRLVSGTAAPAPREGDYEPPV